MKYVENYLSPYVEIESFKSQKEMELELQKDELAYVGLEFPDDYKVFNKVKNI